MTSVIDGRRSLPARMTAVAKLFLCRADNIIKSRRIADLKRSNAALRDKLSQLESILDERLGDRDTLQAIGVTRQQDGSWLFNFDCLLHCMAKEDIQDIRDACNKIPYVTKH